MNVLRRHGARELLDLGCGWNASLLKAAAPYIVRGVGIDKKAPVINSARLCTIRAYIGTNLPFVDRTFDMVTALAVLEHVHDPLSLLREIGRVLRRDGLAVITVPSPSAKPVLEWLAFRMKVISAAEIADHKRYFAKADLETLCFRAGLVMVSHHYFQFGFNNFAVLCRPESTGSIQMQQQPA